MVTNAAELKSWRSSSLEVGARTAAAGVGDLEGAAGGVARRRGVGDVGDAATGAARWQGVGDLGDAAAGVAREKS